MGLYPPLTRPYPWPMKKFCQPAPTQKKIFLPTPPRSTAAGPPCLPDVPVSLSALPPPAARSTTMAAAALTITLRDAFPSSPLHHPCPARVPCHFPFSGGDRKVFVPMEAPARGSWWRSDRGRRLRMPVLCRAGTVMARPSIACGRRNPSPELAAPVVDGLSDLERRHLPRTRRTRRRDPQTRRGLPQAPRRRKESALLRQCLAHISSLRSPAGRRCRPLGLSAARSWRGPRLDGAERRTGGGGALPR